MARRARSFAEYLIIWRVDPQTDYFQLPGNWVAAVRIGNFGQASVYCPGFNKLLEQTPQATGTDRNWHKQNKESSHGNPDRDGSYGRHPA